MNELEKYILKNRQALDDIEMPDIDKMWLHIEKSSVEAKKHIKKGGLIIALRKLAIAASFMLIGGVAVWLYLPTSVDTPSSQLANFYPELIDVEQNYRKAIALKEANIPFDSLDYFLFTDILKELERLEDTHQETLKDMPKYAQNDRLVDALMRYYERKIQILERISNEYQKNKNHERKKEIRI